MTHKLINTRDYLLIVDDSEIKEGDLWYNASIARIWKVSADNVAMYNQPSNMDRTGLNKIIAHLPLNNSPILEGVDLLPPLEDDSNKLAYEYAVNYRCPATNDKEYCKHDIISAYNNGYNKAKEKYKYTEEDLKNEIIRAFKYGQSNAEMIEAGLERDEIDDYTNNRIQSLQQPKIPVGFECEIDDVGYPVMFPESNKKYYSNSDSMYVNYQEKTTTNSQGLTQWVGEYIN